MKPYPKYKDSGIEWIGAVPAGWGLVPIKTLFRVVNGATPKSDVPDFWDGGVVWLTPADFPGDWARPISTSARTLSLEGLNSCAAAVVPPGSIVISTRAPIGSLAFAEVPLAFNQGCRALLPKQSLEIRYFLYFLIIARVPLNLLGRGTTFLELSSDALAAFRVCLPPLPGQIAIAAFLDRETAKIDALIAKYRAMIDLLREKRQAMISRAVTKGLDPNVAMKDSGVEWLGPAPIHWDIVPVSYRYDVQLGRMLNEARAKGPDLRPYLRVFDVQWGTINVSDLPLMNFPEDARARYRLQVGDLLVNEGGSYVGRSAIWKGEIDECYYQKALHRLRAIDQTRDFAPFFLYMMEFATRAGVFVASGNQTTIDHLTAEQLQRHRFPFPNYKEQTVIAAFLDQRTGEIDTLIQSAEKAVTLTQERRCALISAAVAGRIDCRPESSKAVLEVAA